MKTTCALWGHATVPVYGCGWTGRGRGRRDVSFEVPRPPTTQIYRSRNAPTAVGRRRPAEAATAPRGAEDNSHFPRPQRE